MSQSEDPTPREKNVEALCKRPTRALRIMLKSRMIRLGRFVELDAPELMINREVRLVEEVKEALRRRGEEPVVNG